MAQPSFSLKSLTLRSFRSVVDEQTIPLPTSGMYLLVGTSGAGKTTLAEGIAFALGYSNYNATDLQTWDWLTKEPLKVALELDTPSGALKVTRGKNASISMPGEDKPRTSAKAVKEGLVKALGIDPERFLAPLTYRSQKTPGLFLSMVDSEKKLFLTQLLGLDAFERVIEKSVTTISTLTSAAERAQVKHHTLSTSAPVPPALPQLIDLSATRTALTEAEAAAERLRIAVEEVKIADLALVTKQASVVAAVKAEWEPKLHAARQAYNSVPAADTTQYEVELRANRTEQEELLRGHRAELAAVEKDHAAMKQEQTQYLGIVARSSGAQARLTQAEADHDQISASTCFTCGREWPDDPNKVAALAKCESVIKELKENILQAVLATRELAYLSCRLDDCEKVLATIKAENPIPQALKDREQQLIGLIASAKSDQSAQIAELKAQYHKLSREFDRALVAASAMTPEEEQVRRMLGDLKNEWTASQHKVVSIKQSITAYERQNELLSSQYQQALAAVARHEGLVKEAAAAASQAEVEVAEEKDFLGMARGFLNYIFDETLARIADATNARLAMIPNVAGITLRFTSERETASGKLRQEIVPVCEKNGHTIPLKAGVSGGMYSTIELAVDLSLADVIAERTGVLPGWLLLDEAFEGLNGPSKAACFDMLKAISADRAVFVVDHACEMQELFDARIRVEFDGTRTRVVLQ